MPRTATLAGRALLAACVGVSVYLLGHLVAFQYGRDQAIFAFVADRMLDGHPLYRGAWDFKWPGIYFLYAAAQAVLGSGMWAIRLVEALLVASTAVPFVLLSRRAVGEAGAGILGWAIAVYAHTKLEFWNTAQTESFAGVAIVWAIWLATAGGRTARIAAGALYGAAALLKPTLGLPILATWAWLVFTRRPPGTTPAAWARATGVALGVGAAVPALLAVIYFAVTGSLADARETLFVVGPRYVAERLAPQYIVGLFVTAVVQWASKFSTYSLLGLPLLLALAPRDSRERASALHVAAVAAVALLGVAAQGRFFAYHFGAALPLGALLSGWGLWKLWAVWRRRTVGVAGFLAVLLLLFDPRVSGVDERFNLWERCRVRLHALAHPEAREAAWNALYSTGDMDRRSLREVAEIIRRGTPPGARLYVWGVQPLLYRFAERPAASRYCINIPQRVPWDATARTKLLEDLRRTPPAVVVVEHGDAMPTLTGDELDSAGALPGFRGLATLLADEYEPAFRAGRFDVFLRSAAAGR